MQIEELRKLPLDEKLRLVEALWDDIGSSHASPCVLDWVKAEARRRADELQKDPGATLTRAEVWNAVGEEMPDCLRLSLTALLRSNAPSCRISRGVWWPAIYDFRFSSTPLS